MYGSYTSIPDVRSAMPMLHAKCVPVGPEWKYEYSWSGERVLASKQGMAVRVASVAGRRDLTNRFPGVAAALARSRATTLVIDGIVRSLEMRQLELFRGDREPANGAPGIRLIALDVLWTDAGDIRNTSWAIRQRQLIELIAGTGVLVPMELTDDPARLLGQANGVGADGVIAKRQDSRYRPFARHGDWVITSFRALRRVDRLQVSQQGGNPPTKAVHSGAPFEGEIDGLRGSRGDPVIAGSG